MKIVLIFVFGVCFSLQAQQKVNKILDKGDKKLAKLDTMAALSLYDRSLDVDSACADAYAKISDVFISRGNYKNAMELLNAGIRITADIPKDKKTISHLYSIRSFIHFTEERFHHAIQDLVRLPK